MDITLTKTHQIELNEVVILQVRDHFEERKISVRIQDVPRPILLWGPDQYDSTEARNWTNDTVYIKTVDILSKPNVPFE